MASPRPRFGGAILTLSHHVTQDWPRYPNESLGKAAVVDLHKAEPEPTGSVRRVFHGPSFIPMCSRAI